jgi:hypothetical protein
MTKFPHTSTPVLERRAVYIHISFEDTATISPKGKVRLGFLQIATHYLEKLALYLKSNQTKLN